MGIFSKWTEKARVKEAAKQLWQAIQRGHNFEVPLVFDKNDLTVQAIVELQKQHPEAELRMYQSKGLVLGLFRNDMAQTSFARVSAGAFDLLRKAGTVDPSTKNNAEDLLASHEAWIRKQGWDPVALEKQAQEERMKREAITVSPETEKVLKEQGALVDANTTESK